MTLPDERYRAMASLPDNLFRLADKVGPIRKREFQDVVRMILRHYPTPHELEVMADRCPNLLRLPTQRRPR